MFILLVIAAIAIILLGLLVFTLMFAQRRKSGRGNDQSGLSSERGRPEKPKVGRATGPD